MKGQRKLANTTVSNQLPERKALRYEEEFLTSAEIRKDIAKIFIYDSRESIGNGEIFTKDILQDFFKNKYNDTCKLIDEIDKRIYTLELAQERIADPLKKENVQEKLDEIYFFMYRISNIRDTSKELLAGRTKKTDISEELLIKEDREEERTNLMKEKQEILGYLKDPYQEIEEEREDY